MGEVGVEYLVHRLSTKIKYQSNKIEINDSFSKTEQSISLRGKQFSFNAYGFQ